VTSVGICTVLKTTLEIGAMTRVDSEAELCVNWVEMEFVVELDIVVVVKVGVVSLRCDQEVAEDNDVAEYVESSVVSNDIFVGFSTLKTCDAVARRCDIWKFKMFRASSTDLSQHSCSQKRN
jgi:hypothetical protein